MAIFTYVMFSRVHKDPKIIKKSEMPLKKGDIDSFLLEKGGRNGKSPKISAIGCFILLPIEIRHSQMRNVISPPNTNQGTY